MIVAKFTGDGIQRFTKLSEELGSYKARQIYAKAINDEGAKAATATGKALVEQTNLPKRVGRKAMKKRVRANPTSLKFDIETKGGQIRVKYFKPRETRAGVTAAPRNNRQLFIGTFMRAGWWPNRVVKPNWNRQVFYRVGKKFKVAKTDVWIPKEVVIGQTAETFNQSKHGLDVRVSHYLRRLAGGALS